MATVKVMQMEPFKNERGETVNYERLCIIGYVGGEIHTLELKLEKSELLLAKMLLSSTEDKPEQTTHKATAEEQQSFIEQNQTNKKQKTILDEDDDPSDDWIAQD